MRQVTLGRHGPQVSEICLGTMTFGNETPQDVAFSQMDRALDAGISFFDTAEMYPVNPVSDQTAGITEQIIGRWLARRGARNRVQIATKVTGPGSSVRQGKGYGPDNLRAMVEASLRRLGVDCIDLYQLHWPLRGSYHFRQMWNYNPSKQDKAANLDHIDAMLAVLADLRAEGKLRAFGLSNDSAWGVTQWATRSEAGQGPRVVSVQNEYSLLYRAHDTDMAEACVNEDVTLLAYSPLAAGLLTGKYQDGVPDPSRAATDLAQGGKGSLGGRRTDRALAAVAALQAVARDHGLDLLTLALGFLRHRPFPIVPIIGATTDAQLAAQIAAWQTDLPPEAVRAANAVWRSHPFPY
ncbi:aldo/keto reductase [Paracoccus jiaweipingae]|uniref:aldo/keto reductase n=1 Tax=unclassified Paracoccus (in: a-proteobacteria) TaxID=2688777 RepID=UPI0037AE2796